MKLLDAIKQLNVHDLTQLNKIQFVLESRLDWLNDREPESSGMVYDEWSDKVDDLQDIIDNVIDLREETNDETKSELIEEIKSSVHLYQLIHKGLSRLKL